jgi:hypothetical protein
MGTFFWVRRFLLVALTMFVIIGGAQLLKGRPPMYSLEQGLIWSLISATIFTVSRFYQARRGQHCALCNDIPSGDAPKP